MSGPHKIDTLTKDWSPKKLALVEGRKTVLREEMALHEARKALEISQDRLAARLDVNRPAVAKLERRADMHVSKLGGIVPAMGGTLRVVASFPRGDVTITNFKVARSGRKPRRSDGVTARG